MPQMAQGAQSVAYPCGNLRLKPFRGFLWWRPVAWASHGEGPAARMLTCPGLPLSHGPAVSWPLPSPSLGPRLSAPQTSISQAPRSVLALT